MRADEGTGGGCDTTGASEVRAGLWEIVMVVMLEQRREMKMKML